IRVHAAQHREAILQVGLVPILERDRLPRASAREDRVAREQICISIGRLEAKARASRGVTWTWYHLDIAEMNLASLKGDVDRTELVACRSGEPVAGKLRTEHFFDAGETRRGFMPMGQILMRDPAELLDVSMVAIVLGSAEQDVARLPHQQIGVQRQ